MDDYMIKLSDFIDAGGGAFSNPPASSQRWESSGEFIAPSAGFIEVTISAGGAGGDDLPSFVSGSEPTKGGDSKLHYRGQEVLLEGGVLSKSSDPFPQVVYPSGWKFGGSYPSTSVLNSESQNQILSGSDLFVAGAGAHGGGGGLKEDDKGHVWSFDEKQDGASILSLHLPVEKGEVVGFTIGAGGASGRHNTSIGTTYFSGTGGSGICIINFYER